MKPNCLKIVSNRDGELGSVWSKSSLGDFFRTYEIGKPTYPKEGTLLFCHLLNDSTLSNEFFYCPISPTYLAYAEDLQPFKIKTNFSSVPIEEAIRKYWENQKSKLKYDNEPVRANWALASSITLLERLQ